MTPERILYSLYHPQGSLGRHLPSHSTLGDRALWYLSMADQDQGLAGDLAQALEPFGWRLLYHLTLFGLKVKVLEDAQYSQRYGDYNRRSPGSGKGGHYENSKKTMVIRDSCWNEDTIRHECGHAIDSLLGSQAGTRFDEVSTSLRHGFQSQRSGFVSNYAATQPRSKWRG